ncbi:MAG: hypothetical protein QM368_08545 [Bacillota bacterium]|nr:hypothetical protein [Bacillota bacterium]
MNFVNGILSDTHETSEEIDWGKTAIGHSGAGEARAWKGQIAEIMIFAEMLEDDDQKELENYLYNKWLQPKEPRPLSDISFAVSPYLRAGSPGTAAGASIGSLSAADGYGSISYSLVSGDGDSDNGRFKIEGNSIIIQGADLTEGTYRFRVRAEDYYSRLEKSFSVTVFGGSVQIPGLVLHLDASALQGLEDKSPVESWEDLSGTGNHVSQDNPGSRPTYLANGLYGKPAVKFDGVDDYLNQPWTGTGGTLELEAATVFLVLKNENMSASQTMMGNYDEDGAVCFHISRNQNTFTATVSSRDNRIEFTDSLKPYVATYRVDGSSHQAFVNGVKIENENEKLAASINWGATTIGRNGGPLSSNVEEWYWEGSIAEIRSYNSALSDSERQAVENELQQKWFGSPGEARIYYNPYESVNWDTVKQYKANFHTHTTESDGRISPREVINAYSNAGYRILVITDHDSFGGADTTWPWTKWIDEEPDHINSNSGMETSVFYSNLGPGGMLAVRGNEISSTDHIGSFFSDYGGAAAGQEEYALQQIQGKNGLAMIYHPGRYNRSDSWYKELYKKYHQAPLIGMEVYNQGDRYGNDRNTWDRVNALVMPEIVIFGYSGDDMHYQEHRFRNYQFMLMEELTEEALREAMLKGAFYFCYESGGSGAPEPPVPRINRIEVSEDKTVITITASNADSIVWVTDKGEVARGASINLKDLNLNGAKFIRAELRNGTGVTHTQPFALAYIS